jgi:hypothetical protein
MTGEELVVAVIVAAAALFLVWRLVAAGRPRRRRKPDVPVSRLVRRDGDEPPGPGPR